MRSTTSTYVRRRLSDEDTAEIDAAQPAGAHVSILEVVAANAYATGRYRATITGDGYQGSAWAASPIEAFRAARRSWSGVPA